LTVERISLYTGFINGLIIIAALFFIKSLLTSLFPREGLPLFGKVD
jgi:hypothetical protein